ncbi:MAG: hypothetical protein BECKG1743E_GA0114224_103454, partial [Candidatus Kentron sp. G]
MEIGVRRPLEVKAIGRKEYTELRRIFVWIQGARQAHRSLCNCYCNAQVLRPSKFEGHCPMIRHGCRMALMVALNW